MKLWGNRAFWGNNLVIPTNLKSTHLLIKAAIPMSGIYPNETTTRAYGRMCRGALQCCWKLREAGY